MTKLFFCLIVLVVSDAVLMLQHYTFSDSANGWLKLHQVPATWQDAYTTCYAEGAVLASPLNANIIDNIRVHMLINKVDRPIYLGVSGLNSKGYFVSIEGVPLDNMPVIWGSYGDGKKTEDCLTYTSDGKVYTSSCEEYLPYFCYKKNESEVMNECGTFDYKYQLNARTGSCYKVHTEKKLWSEAQKICLAEAGHLVVLNNQEETDIVVNLLSAITKPPGVRIPLIHVGILTWSNDFTWVTVTGEKVDDVYNQWKEARSEDSRKTCACLLTDSSLDQFWWSVRLRFVCEKNPNTIQFELGQRGISDRRLREETN